MEPPVRMVPMEHQKYWSLQHWEWVNDREGWRLAAPLTAAARANSSNSNGPKADAIPFPPITIQYNLFLNVATVC